MARNRGFLPINEEKNMLSDAGNGIKNLVKIQSFLVFVRNGNAK